MDLKHQVSISSVDSSHQSKPQIVNTHKKVKVNRSFVELQPFRLLYKCIHPASNIKSAKVMVSEDSSIKKQQSKAQIKEKECEVIEVNSIRSFSLSRMGLRNYDDMENQDVILQDQISNKCKIFGIFDGHGEYGKAIAESAKTIFKSLLQKYSQEIKNQNSILSIENIIKKVLEKTNLYILHYRVEQAQLSGTTALIVLITSHKIYTFNIGNSRAVLAKHYEKINKIQPFQITHDHTIARFDERARILKNGGIISPFKNEKGEHLGPQRIWVKNQSYPGMFITRTLGLSCAHKVGVISTPEMSIIEYKKCYKYLILGSDGFWSVQENDEAVKFVETGYKDNLERLANSLMSEAIRRWGSKNVLMDDVTLIIIVLN